MLRLHIYPKEDIQNKEAFLRCAVRSLAIDQHRHDRSKVMRRSADEDVHRQSPLIAPSPTSDQILDDQQRLDAIAGLLDAVNPRMRAIYLARRIDEPKMPLHDLTNVCNA